MIRFSLRGWCAVVLAVAGLAAPAQGEKLSKAEIARRGKATTALVQVHPSAVAGTAFGVHPSGYFVTAERVVASIPDGGEITLVLDTGLKTQKAIKARLARRDRELGLALLHVEGSKGLSHLSLGSADQLSELAELVLLGFTAGGRLALKDPEYPSVTVDVATVTSLNKKGGELTAIELKGGPKPALSGGPLLADDGAVAGVILSSNRTGTAAVPINQLVRFLSVPDFQFTAPALTRANRHQPARFQVRVVSVVPPSQPPTVELVLRAGDEPESRHKMESKDGVYSTSAVPVPPDEERRLEVSVQFDSGSLTGFVADREIQVNGQKIKLSACTRLQLQPRTLVLLGGGKTLEGMAAGLDRVEVLIGGQPLMLNLSRAAVIQVLPTSPIAAVDCTLIARQDGKEAGRFQARLPIRGVSLGQPADLTGAGIKPAALAEDRIVRKLPDTASDICVGGGGRYLVLHLPKLKKLAIFDVNEAAISRYIPLTENKIVYAAGLDKVVIGLTVKGVLERWDLHTGEKELSRAVPGAADITRVLMGSASRGPIVVNDGFFDLATLRPLPIKSPSNVPAPWSPVSADGTVFGAWKPNQSPAESTTFVLQGDELKRYDEGGVGHVVPGPDGRAVYTAAGVRSNQLKGVSGVPKPSYCLPALEGDYFLSLTAAEKGKGGNLAVYLLGNEQPLLKDVGFTHGIHFDGWDRNFFGPWKRIFFIPRAKLIVVFPESNDKLELHRFDVEAALEKSGLDYLLVTSRPPTRAKRGAEYTYQMAVKSKQGGVTFKLGAGPEGLAVSPAGLVKWRVPADAKVNSSEVILTVRDASGQELFHTFTLWLTDE